MPSQESKDAVRKMNLALGKIGQYLKTQGAWLPSFAEFYADAIHAAAHRMVDSLTTQLAVVLTQRLNAPHEMTQVVLTGFQHTEDAHTGDLAHDLVVRYATDLELGLLSDGYEVMLAYLGSHITDYANNRLDELGFTEDGKDKSTQDLTNPF